MEHQDFLLTPQVVPVPSSAPADAPPLVGSPRFASADGKRLVFQKLVEGFGYVKSWCDDQSPLYAQIIAGAFGPVESYEAPPAPPLGDIRKMAKAAIETEFAAALAPYLPRMPGYELREAQAIAYKAAGYTGDVPSQVASFQVAAGLTPTAATDTILAQAAAFRAALNELETRRMRKFEVDAMTDARAIEANAAQIAGEIKAIAAML